MYLRRRRNPFVNDLPTPVLSTDGSVRVPLCGKDLTKFAVVDFADAPLVVEHRWYVGHGYAVSNSHRLGTTRTSKGRNANIAMHRLIMGSPPQPNLVVDHVNGDRLDNRRKNLRWVTVTENNHNLAFHRQETPRSIQNPFGYLGVSRGHNTASWQVRVGTKGFGHWVDPKLAARVYDAVVRTLRPKQRALNFPDNPLPEDFVIPGLNALPRRAAYRSNVPGVSWFKPRNKWRVIVAKKTLGYFNTQQEAEAFRRSLEK